MFGLIAICNVLIMYFAILYFLFSFVYIFF